MSTPSKRPNHAPYRPVGQRPAKVRLGGSDFELHPSDGDLPDAYQRIRGTLRRIHDRAFIERLVVQWHAEHPSAARGNISRSGDNSCAGVRA